MKNKVINFSIKIICVLLLLSIFTPLVSYDVSAKSSKYAADDLEKVIDGILAFKQSQAEVSSVQELIDSELTKKAGTSPTEWYVIALSRYKEDYDYSKYLLALDSYVKKTKKAKATDLQRIALAYSLQGANEKFINKTIKDCVGQLGVMSYIYGLILLDTNAYESNEISREDIIDEILSLRLADGGWALSGKTSDVDVSAMALQALAPYYDDSDVKTAVDSALTLLSKMQLKSGDFKSWGVRSCESTAQVITALCALNIDCQTDKRFIKNKKTLLDGLMLYAHSDGSFSHTIDGVSNDTASVQAMYSLVAVWRQMKGLNTLYDFTDLSKAADILQDNLVSVQESDTELKEDKEFSETDAANTASVSSVQETTSRTEGNDKKQERGSSPMDYKMLVSILAFIVMLISMAILFLRKKLNKKKVLFLIALTGIMITAVWSLRIQSVEDYYDTDTEVVTTGSETVTISIRCDSVAGELNSSEIPADGIVLDNTEYVIEKEDTVFDILVRATKQNQIQLDYEGEDSNSLSTVYVKGINQLYEYDFGELSGWMFKVNGEFPGEGCDNYIVSDKDVIEWVYTRDLGKDVGGE